MGEPEASSTNVSEPASPNRHTELDELFSMAYEELRRLASAVSRSEGSFTLGPTALVHEAWLKLAPSLNLEPQSQLHFRRIAARAMRQVLVEAARKRQAEKRGGADAAFVTFDEGLDGQVNTAGELLDLNEALNALAKLDARQAQVVEARFFGGLEVAETAELLQVSEATVMRDWRVARAWLAIRLEGVR